MSNIIELIIDWMCSLDRTWFCAFLFTLWIVVILILHGIRWCLLWLYMNVCTLIYGDDIEFYYADSEGGYGDESGHVSVRSGQHETF